MKTSSQEKQYLVDSSSYLESHKNFLPLSDFDLSLLSNLLESNNNDLAYMGCYCLSYMDPRFDPYFLANSNESAKNVARFLLSTKSETQILSSRTSTVLAQSVRNLSNNIPKSATSSVIQAKSTSMTIIIHGTFAKTSNWWQRGGTFWNHINNIVGDVYSGPSPFFWSGKNSHKHREKAAEDLCQWAIKNPTNNLRIIAHSHGGNVCLLAAKKGLVIDNLITLGTPIRLEYLPNLQNIKKFSNVFSTSDYIQTPTGTIPNTRGEGRTLGENYTVTNYIAFDDGNGGRPGHSELHEPLTWDSSDLNILL